MTHFWIATLQLRAIKGTVLPKMEIVIKYSFIICHKSAWVSFCWTLEKTFWRMLNGGNYWMLWLLTASGYWFTTFLIFFFYVQQKKQGLEAVRCVICSQLLFVGEVSLLRVIIEVCHIWIFLDFLFFRFWCETKPYGKHFLLYFYKFLSVFTVVMF